MGFDIEIDLQDVKNFAESDTFAQFLLSNTTSFETAAFILQAVLNAIEDAAASIDKDENI